MSVAPTRQGEFVSKDQPPPGRRGPAGFVVVAMVVVFLVAFAGVGAGWLLWGGSPSDLEVTAATATTTATTAAPTREQGVEPVVAVARAMLPTVVQVQTSTGLGSGVVYDADGLILTAAHVVAEEQQVVIRLADGEQVTGVIVGADVNSDIAVIRIDRSGLTAAPLALDTALQVGQTAVALGSPYGLEQTVTAGVVSAVDRAVVGVDGRVRTALQTDAPINPGNSGGPLADLEGRVIGINDAIFSQSGGNEGVGFAVPITVAKHVADLLVAGEPVQIAFLGITGADPTQGTAGVKIMDVMVGSPAESAGILVGDLITALDGDRVESMVELAAGVRSHQPGDRVSIHLIRRGEDLDLVVTLGSAE